MFVTDCARGRRRARGKKKSNGTHSRASHRVPRRSIWPEYRPRSSTAAKRKSVYGYLVSGGTDGDASDGIAADQTGCNLLRISARRAVFPRVRAHNSIPIPARHHLPVHPLMLAAVLDLGRYAGQIERRGTRCEARVCVPLLLSRAARRQPLSSAVAQPDPNSHSQSDSKACARS